MAKTADRSQLEATQAADSDLPAITPADIRVLIVDNDEAHAETVAESLQRIGYDCAVATSGAEGVRLIDRETFDVVITDLVMSDVNGIEILKHPVRLLARLRSDPCHRPRNDPVGRGVDAARGV